MIIKGVGSIDRTEDRWDLSLTSPVVVMLGAVTLDITQAHLSPGQNYLTVVGGIGNVVIKLPRGLPVSGHVFTALGSQRLLSRREGGILYGTTFSEAGSSEAESNLRITVVNLIGDLSLEYE